MHRRFAFLVRLEQFFLLSIVYFLINSLCRQVHANPGAYLSPYGSRPNHDTSADITNQIRSSQQYFERILMTIEEKLDTINSRQKSERAINNMVSNVMNDLQMISTRIQNIEDQLARTESSNKMKIDKILENIQKEEFTIDQLAHKVEKNQQLFNNRLIDIESTLEKISNTQEDLSKDIRKINSVQSELMSTVKEVKEDMQNVKLVATESFQSLNITQNTFHQHLTHMIRNATSHAEITDTVRKLGEQLNNNTASGVLKCTQSDAAHQTRHSKNPLVLDEIQKDLQEESVKLIALVDSMYNGLRQQIQVIETISKESLEINHKIYKKLDNDALESIAGFCENVNDNIAREMGNAMRRNINILENKINGLFERILTEQRTFMGECGRLQLDEETESKLIIILEKIIEMINNRTNGISQNYVELSKQIQTYQGNHNEKIDDLSKSFLTHRSHITRTIAHATNRITEIEKNSKQLQTTVNSIKDVCYNVSNNIQEINQNINKVVKLSQKESSAVTVSSVEVENGTRSEISGEKNKAKFSPIDNLTNSESTVKFNEQMDQFSSKTRQELYSYQHKNSSTFSSKSSGYSQTSPIIPDESAKSKTTMSTLVPPPNYSTGETVLNTDSKSAPSANHRSNYSSQNENISETLLKLFKASKRKISQKPANGLVKEASTTDQYKQQPSETDRNGKQNQVWKFSNELTNTNEPASAAESDEVSFQPRTQNPAYLNGDIISNENNGNDEDELDRMND